MDINKLAGWCLILVAVIIVLQAIMHHLRNLGSPGAFFALVTAALVTVGVVLIVRRPIPYGKK
jgi:hypothetical protein